MSSMNHEVATDSQQNGYTPGRSDFVVVPGNRGPLGVTCDSKGANFAIFSEHATRVELCLFENVSGDRRREHRSIGAGTRQHSPQFCEIARIPLPGHSGPVWHGHVAGLRPGTVYGYRIHGPYDPAAGHRYNPAKVVLDPYARGLACEPRYDRELLGYVTDPWDPNNRSPEDNVHCAPLAVIVDERSRPSFTSPKRPLAETIIYEAHVKGLTALHPLVPPEIRGTYLGVCSPPIITHLHELGVTAIELLPVFQSMTEWPLVIRGQRNYWGYSTLSYFSPDLRFATVADANVAREEFRTMVRTLHEAGIEVILDVVYNHTCEANESGPTLSFRGVDHAAYYALRADSPRALADVTGCGNTLNLENPYTLQLVLDSLRFWVEEMGVDGFRFDLTTALARVQGTYSRQSPFLLAVHQDPVLAKVKLISEPWDVGYGGYQIGNFPSGWSEWNGPFRDVVRSYWRGEEGLIGSFANRISGSSDMFWAGNRGPTASINFITAHDGFTLLDLVSYNEKHNEANGESNRDGESYNRSWNFGAEGHTNDPKIISERMKQRKNFLTTLFLAAGVPMLVAGDELSHTQNGNNNAYCHDNELVWLNWELDDEKREILEFVKKVIGIRRSFPHFHPDRFFSGDSKVSGTDPDLSWFDRDGALMSIDRWNNPHVKSVGMLLNSLSANKGTTHFVVWNADDVAIEFRFPLGSGPWHSILDTSVSVRTSSANDGTTTPGAVESPVIAARSVVVFERSENAADARIRKREVKA